MATGLTWKQAEELARQGRSIRRHAWERWVWLSAPRIWKVRLYVGNLIVERVVTNTDVTVADHTATDWTDQGWGGSLEEPTGPGTGSPNTPPATGGDDFPIERVTFAVDGEPVDFDVKARRIS